jgi:hypothetical protein
MVEGNGPLPRLLLPNGEPMSGAFIRFAPLLRRRDGSWGSLYETAKTLRAPTAKSPGRRRRAVSGCPGRSTFRFHRMAASRSIPRRASWLWNGSF